ncbi:aromatic acid exporter family protein [Bacillus suaedaesalsae]|uniref:Aromatic acid exporter family protein n=1 Tax=Bacillus suaedaesalsae TaxID=2810349 RepID=A0ABS2DFZ3_9BACI|nr:aromatic acid exporter family protein [Bacillus suaedaesalsae]MBM6617369.1 aromatic acid exporter family protein [Bacillus suaedaesalsae]
MFKIGYRTIKTALGVSIAIFIAAMLELEYYTSAGIITILCIQATKKKSLKSSWSRLLASTVAIIFSFIIFKIIGYTPISLGVILLFFIPTTVFLRIQEGIVTSSVIIFHLYNKKSFTIDFLLNEYAIISIGIGVALIMNLYMPSVDKELKKYQKEIERYFAFIFKEIAVYLRQQESSWDGKELTLAHESIEEAKSLAIRDIQNHITRYENTYYSYFKIRERQLQIIERVLPLVTSLTHSCEQGEILAEFVDDISNSIHPGNTAKRFLDKIEELKTAFRQMELPKTREEFEARASLHQFFREMEQYLIIKSYFRPNYE